MDRERIEAKLASWLRKHHRAEVVKEIPGKVPDTSDAQFQIVARCAECAAQLMRRSVAAFVMDLEQCESWYRSRLADPSELIRTVTPFCGSPRAAKLTLY